MERISKVVPAFTLLALLALVTQPGLCLAEEAGSKKVYLVKPGDTLSGIAGRFLGDIHRWREILKENSQITDPDRIYPGDTLVLPIPAPEPLPVTTPEELVVRDEVPAAPPPSPAEAAASLRVPEVEEPPLRVEKIEAVPVISPALYRVAGYITKDLPRESIVSSAEEKIAMGEGDAIVINVPADKGTLYTVIRPEREVFHPRTREFLGWVIRVLGKAEVTCPGPQLSAAVLREANDYIEVGDLLVPFDPEDVLEENVLGPKVKDRCLREGKEDACIVASKEDRSLFAEGDIVFLDKGRADGVIPGKKFLVYREVDPENRYMVGQLQVLRAREQTSTALVTSSSLELQVEDLAQAW